MRLVYAALGWCAGILLAANAEQTSLTPLVWLVLAALSLLVVWLWWQDVTSRGLAVLLVMLALGALRLSLHPTTSDIARYNNLGGLTIEGLVVDEPEVRDDRIQLRLQAETVTRAGSTYPTQGVVLVYAPRLREVNYGDRISATGELTTPAQYDTFSYADFLAREGVFSLMRNGAIEVTARDRGNPLYAALLSLKQQSQRAIQAAMPEPQAGLLNGILLGNERGIAPEVAEDFNAVGAAHVVAISGFNMVILSGVITRLLDRVGLRKRYAALIGIVVIALYTLFVGANPAVVRAAVMSSILVIGQAIRRKTFVPASLAFVVLVMSLHNPTVLWDVGFQLSFFATLGLALYAEPLTRWFDRFLYRLLPGRLARTTGRFLSEPLIVTLAAQITTLPLIVVYFGRVSLVFVFVNLLIVPPQAALLILGLVATMLVFVSPAAAQILYWFDMLLLAWTIGIVRFFAEIPFAQVEFYADPRLVALYFVVLLGAAMIQATQPDWSLRLRRVIRQRAVTSAVLFAGVLTAVLLLSIFLSRPDGRLHLWLLDVGHSNAVLIQTPRGAQILVDGGRFPSRLLTAIGDRMPFYDREIEVLVLTQPDVFEYGALPAVLERYDIGVALTNGQANLSEDFAAFQSQLAQHEVLTVRAGYTLTLDDGVRLEVLHPQAAPPTGANPDDHVLTLRVQYGESRFLLTADLSSEGQQMLLEGGQWPLAAVMQMPQHGATRSLNKMFLEAAQPQVVILQSDPTNLRSDPDADTLALLNDTPLYRTDDGGTIHLWTDGSAVWVAQ